MASRPYLTAGILVGVIVGMGGLVAVSEPLYRLFCQATGYAGTPRVAEGTKGTVSDQTVTVSFDANVNRELGWRFKPEARSVTLRLGEETLAFFDATNTTNQPLVGTASFNVSPDAAAPYFNKIQCFCFTEQVLAAGESARLPVSFFVDPDILKDRDARNVKHITLSYTFFKDIDQSKAASTPPVSN
jgi:cytochrome c oxidase assembly protein subunit 11